MYKIYGKDNCQFCEKAVNLLTAKGLDFDYKKLGVDFTREQLLELVPTARTVPQIFDGEVLVGGFTELQELLA